MASAAHPLQNSATVTVNIPTQTLSMTTRKTALTAVKILGILTIGVGIGYLIAIKTVKSDPCLGSSLPATSPDAAFWNGCCRPLFNLIECLGNNVPNFSRALDQCPTSSDCDP